MDSERDWVRQFRHSKSEIRFHPVGDIKIGRLLGNANDGSSPGPLGFFYNETGFRA